jgi:acyl-CoA reductase-like NAD-dependent aldehyde dehydrogenase
MTERFELMIPGGSSGAPALLVESPYDRSPVALVAAADAGTIERALDTAARLFRDKDAWIPIRERVVVLERAARLMEEEAGELALGAVREGGKPLADTRVEVARAIDGVKLAAQALREQHGVEVPMNNAAARARLAFTRHEPIGPVVAISAFNHPLNLIVHQAAPAIAAGCPVIVKPAEATPTSALRFAAILREAGLAPEWCQVAVTGDLGLAERLATDPRVAFLSFIGSARVGWMLRSKLAPGTRCALEHGGVAPVIVAPDADLDDAIPLLAKGAFAHAGQVCVSVKRVFAHASIVRQVATRLAERAAALVVGDPLDERTEVGPLIRPGEVERVDAWVREAVGMGAELFTGGVPLGETCYRPTVLFNPPSAARVSREETFGPVVCVYPYYELADAIARANALPFAFQAAVFTRDLDVALSAARGLDASAVMVNDSTTFRVDWMPFAGLRQSGLGVGGIAHTLRDMQVEKMVVVRSKEL